ncbi:tubulin-specific chaperone E-like [Porites lutea]|uniref:tubulin-specific chaperone E-like n=1 Tax=Porites lutea TaxID=51062 RepID=UPI003CC5C423
MKYNTRCLIWAPRRQNYKIFSHYNKYFYWLPFIDQSESGLHFLKLMPPLSQHFEVLNKMADEIVGKRILCEGFRGEIKYVGLVPPTSGEWYGVEWDDHSRGKHDGTHEGVKYFESRHPMGGSFVRPKKVDFGISIFEALKQRYGQGGDSINEEDMYVMSGNNRWKAVEMVGADSIQQKQSDYKTIREVSLRGLTVNGPDKENDFYKVAPNISELDLSKTLLSSWMDVASITRNLKHLQILNLSENLLRLPSEPEQLLPSFSTVTVLFLNKMELGFEEVEVIVGMMPSLKELHVCHNCLKNLRREDGQLCDLQGFQNVQLLNLEGNQLSDWTSILRLGQLPRLSCLILNDNGIESIELGNKVQDGQVDKLLFPVLQSLSLSRNKISQIQSINELNHLPKLSELRFKGNLLFQGETTFDSRQELLARVPSLTSLNGSLVSLKERETAERAYLKKYAKCWINAGGNTADGQASSLNPAFVELHPRYEELIKVHGVPIEAERSQSSSKTLKDSLISVTITCPDAPDKKSVTKKLPGTMTIGKLKGLLYRLFKVDSSDQRLSSVDNKLGREVELDDDLRQLTFYSVQSGDTIYLRW